MSEDEQCGRWETTPEELKAENKKLREMVAKLMLALVNISTVADAAYYEAMGMSALVKEAQTLLVGKTD
jgi:hypothetical protein